MTSKRRGEDDVYVAAVEEWRRLNTLLTADRERFLFNADGAPREEDGKPLLNSGHAMERKAREHVKKLAGEGGYPLPAGIDRFASLDEFPAQEPLAALFEMWAERRAAGLPLV